MPTPSDEDIVLVSLITAPVADAAPYMRRDHFVDMFPSRKAAASWVKDYLIQHRALPALKVLRSKFPEVSVLSRPEPLHDCYEVLVEGFVNNVAGNASDVLASALEKRDFKAFLSASATLSDIIARATRPVEAEPSTDRTFLDDVVAEYDRDKSLALKTFPTGFDPLDKASGGGLRPGSLTVFASLVNLGKTYVAVKVADSLVRAGCNVLFYSLEMPKKDILMRHLVVRHGLDADQYVVYQQPEASVKNGETYEDWYQGTLQKASRAEDDFKLQYPKAGSLTVIGTDAGPITTARMATDLHHTQYDVIIIDAAQDIRDAKESKDRTPALYNAVSELNTLANQHKVAMFLTVQLDAEVEKKGLSKGNLTRIAWGQVFAQKANLVMTMLGERDSGIREIKIEKNRNGKVGKTFWLNMVFPIVKITATDNPPGSLTDLDAASKTAETISELSDLLQDAQASVAPSLTPTPSRTLPPLPPSATAAISRLHARILAPRKAAAPAQPVQAAPADPVDEPDPPGGLAPYHRRAADKAAKKWKR